MRKTLPAMLAMMTVAALTALALPAGAPASASAPASSPAALAGSGAAPAKAPQLGPVNQGFVDSMITATGGLGRRPNPVPFTLGPGATARAARALLPSSYSLVDLGRVTNVRDQGRYGTCWAFANIAAVESKLRPGQTWNFSEDNLVNRNGFGPFDGYSRYDWGGWDLMAVAYFTRWAGPVNEAADRYHTPTPPKVNFVRKHVQGAVMIPGRTGPLDNDVIKQLVIANGALSVGMDFEDDACNGGYTGYMTHYLPTANGENHGVDVVGWDDSFSADNFDGSVDGTPPGDGAFLVRNSWGPRWGENGYFWVSYYDRSFACDQGLDYGGATSYSKVGSATNYARQYSWDRLGPTTDQGYDSTLVWGANTFTAKATQLIRAAGFYTLESGTEWQVWAGPNKQSLTLRASGTSALPGYMTVSLDSPMPVFRGYKFTVALRLVSPTNTYPLACEYAQESWMAGAYASPGQSFASDGSSGWYDVSRDGTNVCLKAFAK